MRRARLLASVASLAVGLATPAHASPITWQFVGTNAVTYEAGGFSPSPVTTGPFTITATFDPSTPGVSFGCGSSSLDYSLLAATFTWGGISYPTSPGSGGVFTGEFGAQPSCAPGTGGVEIGFPSSDDASGFWVALLFTDPETLGGGPPTQTDLVNPLYVEFNWGPFPGFGGPLAQAVGALDAPTVVPEPTSLLLAGLGLLVLGLGRRRRPGPTQQL